MFNTGLYMQGERNKILWVPSASWWYGPARQSTGTFFFCKVLASQLPIYSYSVCEITYYTS